MANLKKILLVDDEADIRQIARMALESIGGFTIEECTSGLDAPGAVERFEPDLVLMDVMMPGQDGPTTLRLLRSTPGLRYIPIVFMTAKVQPQEVAALRALGALDVIAKPFDPLALPETVRRIWATLGQQQG